MSEINQRYIGDGVYLAAVFSWIMEVYGLWFMELPINHRWNGDRTCPMEPEPEPEL